ncbi:hypothetical protein LTR10_006131 [Elasticomyces elasticus]|nr:hypothetical protein LTR10_006131 [Elasticomyces elasticus]KAK4966818.1 hypothetical protein LTR42_011130 [Elasticomyces elasticus]
MCRAHNGLLVRKQRETKRLKNISQGPGSSIGASNAIAANPSAPRVNFLDRLPAELWNYIHEYVIFSEVERRESTDGFERVELGNTVHPLKRWREPRILSILRRAYGTAIGRNASSIYYSKSTFVTHPSLTAAGIEVVCTWLVHVLSVTKFDGKSMLKIRLMMGGCTWVHVPCIIPLLKFLRRYDLGCEVVEYDRMREMKNTEQPRTLAVGMNSKNGNINKVLSALFGFVPRARQHGMSETNFLKKVNEYVKKQLDEGAGLAATIKYRRAADGVGLLWCNDRNGIERLVALPPTDLPLPPTSPTLQALQISLPSHAVAPPDTPTSVAKLYLYSNNAATITTVPVHRHWVTDKALKHVAYFDAQRHGFPFPMVDFKIMADRNEVGTMAPTRVYVPHAQRTNIGYLLHCNGYVEPVTVLTSIKPPTFEALVTCSTVSLQESLDAAYILAQYNGFTGSPHDFEDLAHSCVVELGTDSPWYGQLSTENRLLAGILADQDGRYVPATYICSHHKVDAVKDEAGDAIDAMIVSAQDTIARAYRKGLNVQTTYTANEAADWKYTDGYAGVTPASVSIHYAPPSFHRVQPARDYFLLKLAIRVSDHFVVPAPPALLSNSTNHFYQPGSVNPPMLAFGGTTINHSRSQNTVTGDSFTNPIGMLVEAATGDDAEYPGTPTPGSIMDGLDDVDFSNESLELFDPNGVANGDMNTDFDLDGSMGGGIDGGTY